MEYAISFCDHAFEQTSQEMLDKLFFNGYRHRQLLKYGGLSLECVVICCCFPCVAMLATHEEKDGKPFVIEFDFLGKDSIRYYNSVPVEKQVYKNINLFMKDKSPNDDLFDRLTVGGCGTGGWVGGCGTGGCGIGGSSIGGSTRGLRMNLFVLVSGVDYDVEQTFV